MHTHLFSDDDFPDNLAGDELAIMVANGVTTARLMIGTPEQLALRASIAKGTTFGPTLYVASPQISGVRHGKIFNGRVVTTADEARRAVKDFKAEGYDFVKLTYAISRPVYDAVVETARAENIRVVGHVDTQVGVARALEAGQQIEHLDAYLEAVLRDDSPIKTSVTQVGLFTPENWTSLDHVDDRKVAAVARATAAAGVYSTPTLSFFKVVFGTGVSDDGSAPAPTTGSFHSSCATHGTGPTSASGRRRPRRRGGASTSGSGTGSSPRSTPPAERSWPVRTRPTRSCSTAGRCTASCGASSRRGSRPTRRSRPRRGPRASTSEGSTRSGPSSAASAPTWSCSTRTRSTTSRTPSGASG
jgi:hypothetical protein